MNELERIINENLESEKLNNVILESEISEIKFRMNEKLENKINELKKEFNENLERERLKNETLEDKINEMKRVMNENFDEERLKNEILENKINELKRRILKLIINKNTKESEMKIINENSNKYLNNKNGNNEKGIYKDKKENNENDNEKGDLAKVLYYFMGNTSNELNLHKDEYLIVTNWNVGNGFAFGYKRNDPEKKGVFPSPLVRKCSELD